MSFRKVVVLLLVVFLLSGCSSHQAETTLTATAVIPEIWDISIPPDLDWLRPILNTCAQAEDNVGLIEAGLPSADADNRPFDFRFLTGDTLSSNNLLFNLGSEHLAVIVHPDNPLTELTWQALVDIQAGVITNWQDTSNGQSDSFSEPVIVFQYPANSGIQMVMDSLVAVNQRTNYSALLAPGPYELMTGIKMEVGGIGILPERLVDESVKQLVISGIEKQDFALPILVETKTEPEGSALNFLLCVQNKIK